MEAIQASYAFRFRCCHTNLQLLPPFIHFQHEAFSIPRFSPISTKRRHNHQRGSPLSLTPTVAHSFTDDASSGSAFNAVEVDTSFVVKKKAVEVSPELKGTSVFLVGMNNTIKTSVGKLLADALRYYYFDSDSLVEEAAGGKSAAKSLLQNDEEGFRESETEVLKQLSSMGRLVVCAGNGAVRSTTNLALLRHGISIWIDVPLDMIAREILENQIEVPESGITSSSHSQVLSQLVALYGEMQSGYATADATVSLQKVGGQLGLDELDAVSTEAMGLEVLKELEKLLRVKKMMEEAARPF